MTTTTATVKKIMTEYIGEFIGMIIMFHSRLEFVVSVSVIKNITQVNTFRKQKNWMLDSFYGDLWTFFESHSHKQFWREQNQNVLHTKHIEEESN